MDSRSSPLNAANFPLLEADLCVKCGLCLPHCPTYKLSRDEGESPRGRIALMQGLVAGALTDTPKLRGHLDRCLNCRACEPVCPAGVPYGKLIDSARAGLFAAGPKPPRLLRLMLWLAPRRALWRRFARLLRGMQRIGLPRLWPGRLPALPPAPVAPRYHAGRTFAAHGTERGVIGLFLGCVADPLDAGVHHAAIRVLTQLGYQVELPADQTCCGALHYHNGDREHGLALARRNMNAFPDRFAAVISTATGCGAHLAEYDVQLQEPGATEFVRRTRDINRFVADMDWPEQLSVQPLHRRVAVQIPCTQRNVLRDGDSTRRLLQRIPGIEVMNINHRDCCGAAGSYFLTQPDNARRLAEQTVAALERTGADIMVTPNIGCALQIRAALRHAKLAIEVLHPIELLDRQLASPG